MTSGTGPQPPNRHPPQSPNIVILLSLPILSSSAVSQYCHPPRVLAEDPSTTSHGLMDPLPVAAEDDEWDGSAAPQPSSSAVSQYCHPPQSPDIVILRSLPILSSSAGSGGGSINDFTRPDGSS